WSSDVCSSDLDAIRHERSYQYRDGVVPRVGHRQIWHPIMVEIVHGDGPRDGANGDVLPRPGADHNPGNGVGTRVGHHQILAADCEVRHFSNKDRSEADNIRRGWKEGPVVMVQLH